METEVPRKKKSREYKTIMWIMTLLLIVSVILVLKVFAEIDVLKGDPCKACEELYKMSCISLR